MSDSPSNDIRLEFYHPEENSGKGIPLFHASVPAGFPSPAEDYQDKKLDLNEYLIKHPSATFFVRVSGNSMTGAGIYDGDLLIVDRSLPASDNKIVICVVNGEFTVKRLRKQGAKIFLQPENAAFKTTEIIAGMDFVVWGVVIYCIHKT
jgi:DNA polymerase V